MKKSFYIFFTLFATYATAGIFSGTNAATSIYVGTNAVSEVWSGTNLVWSGTFEPTDLSDCALWLDASDRSTFTLDGSAVETWRDKSDEGDNAVRVGADSTRPTYYANQQNGMGIVRFDGYTYLGTDYCSVDNQTLFAVAKFTSVNKFLLGARDDSSHNSYLYFSTSYHVGGKVGSTPMLYDPLDLGTSYHCLTWWYDGSDIFISSDGGSGATTTQSGSGSNTSAGYYIGVFNNAGTPWSGKFIGDLGEVVIYSRKLSTAEIEQVESYLSDKWGL